MKSIHTDDYIIIVSTMRNIRKELNITQDDLAQRLNVQQSFVSKVENCERRLDVIEFLSWIDALGISIEDIIPKKYLKEVNK